ncbi:MAG: Multicopper oxidase [Candidatus Parcubacteria bacterium]
MSEPSPTQPSVAMEDVKLRSVLIMGTIAVCASIIFGLLYLFVLAPSAPGSSAGWFLFAFATGITMIVMPCTLPLAFVIVPLSMGKGVAKGLGISLAFGFGIAVTQSMYGVIAAIIGSFALGALGAPLESVKNWVYLFAGIFALLFALGEIGLIKVRMPTYTGAAPAFIQRRQDLVKAFLLGLFLGNIGIGCPHPATPLLLIEAASSGNIAYGWLLFMTHAIGRVLPLLLLSFLGILGVNGLSWLMSRKESVERATGWAMVYVAGFILTLGLFTHDWWVNSGIHSALERVTNEQFFNQWFNNALNTAVAHSHGFEVGVGMFGLPLWLGNWFLVAVWVVPMWWWWARKRKALLSSPAFRLREIESRIDRLEKSRRELEEVVKLDDAETDFDLTQHRAQIDSLEKIRREAEEKVQFAEKGALKEPIARSYESRMLAMQRNYLVLFTFFLALIFIHFLPTNFYLNSLSGGDHHGTANPGAPTVASDGHTDHVHTPSGTALTPFSKETAGLPEAKRSEVVTLKDGDTYNITASYVQKRVGNRTLRMMAYNGSVPGPFIYASQGTNATINFTNHTDIDQTIHSHGLRLDNASDGTPGVTQKVVKPGESYLYTVSFPDAGIAWYHPHTRDDIGQELGLYGNYIIDPKDGAYYSPVNRDAPLVLDDILLEGNTNADFYKETVTNALLGRFGNTYLVNGEENYAMPIKKGEVVRFFVTNVSNARTYNLMIPGAEMKVVGADLGKFEKEYMANAAHISPAERLVIEVYFKDAGNYRLTNATPNGITTLATFAVSDEQVDVSYADIFSTLRTDSADALFFSKIRDMAFAPADKRLRLTVDPKGLESVNHDAHQHAGTDASASAAGGHMMPDGTMMGGAMSGSMGGMMKMGMAGIQWDDIGNTDKVNTTQNVTWKLIDEATGKANADIDLASWTFKKGALVKIALTNDMMAAHVMQHPIHLHGQRFVELSRNGVVNQNMVWKDTLLVLPGEKVEIVVDMSNTGVWMLHCHIVEHLFAGMMMSFRVEDADGVAAGDAFRKAASLQVRTQTGTSTAFSYTTPVDAGGYSAIPDATSFAYNKLAYVGFTFLDPGKKQLKLSSNVREPLKVTFVKSDGSAVVTTYPGKSDFVLSTSSVGHVDLPGMPAHTHSFFEVVKVAHADAGHPHDPAMMVDAPRTYTVPVVFTSIGSYRGFVEFVPDGETAPRIASFDITVTQGGFSVDSFGWSKSMKWWILLIASLFLMIPLVWWVRRYINAVV